MSASHAERISGPGAAAGDLLNSMVASLTSGAAAASAWLGEARCGLMGHAMMVQLEPGRMALRCMCCGRQTPGWTLQ
jgi:hypothetical protein